MATIPANTGDLFQVRVGQAFTNITVYNVLHFKATTPSDDVDLRLIQILIQCYLMHLLPGLSNQFALDTVTWKRVAPTLSPEFVSAFPPGSLGPITADPLPSFCAALVSMHTAMGGRSHRGRIYLSGLPEDCTTFNSIVTTTPTWAAILAFVACLIEKFITGEPIGQNQFKIGVYSRKLGGSTFPYQDVGFTPALQLSPVQLIATMRSRKQGKGV
jgi:hypothetical protein